MGLEWVWGLLQPSWLRQVSPPPACFTKPL